VLSRRGGVRGHPRYLTKCLGTNNPHNVVRATIEGSRAFGAEEIAARRGKLVEEVRV